MFQARPVVRSHWHHTFDGLQSSPLDFYDAVENTVARREVPELTVSRVEWRESGILSAKRDYLRVRRGELAFDICTAPFGSGQFFSSWLAELASSPLIGILALFVYSAIYSALAVGGFLVAAKIHWVAFWLLIPIAFFGYFAAIVAILFVVRLGLIHIEAYVRATPLLGRLYDAVFAPDTYYRIDTMLMFQDLVHSAVLECVDAVTANQGLRALAGEERQVQIVDVLTKRRW